MTGPFQAFAPLSQKLDQLVPVSSITRALWAANGYNASLTRAHFELVFRADAVPSVGFSTYTVRRQSGNALLMLSAHSINLSLIYRLTSTFMYTFTAGSYSLLFDSLTSDPSVVHNGILEIQNEVLNCSNSHNTVLDQRL